MFEGDGWVFECEIFGKSMCLLVGFAEKYSGFTEGLWVEGGF